MNRVKMIKFLSRKTRNTENVIIKAEMAGVDADSYRETCKQADELLDVLIEMGISWEDFEETADHINKKLTAICVDLV